MGKFELNEWETRLVKFIETGVPVYWNDEGAIRRIVSIGEVADEPGPCAFLEGIHGKYVATDNTGPEDFSALTEVLEQ